MISNCGHDERGKYTGGQAGDQTGQEWAVIPWYRRPWSCVLRHPDKGVRDALAQLHRAAALNDKIGYDQDNRYSYWEQLKAVGYAPEKIATVCEADCSAGVAANVKAVGFLLGRAELKAVSIYLYTGNMRRQLKNAGFTVLTDNKYLDSADYLLPGDILLYDNHHVAVNLDTGAKAEMAQQYPCWVQSGADWYYRLADGVNAHGWQLINHHWYYFAPDGKMQKGWFQADGDWYYGQPDGPLEGALYHTDAAGKQQIWYVA